MDYVLFQHVQDIQRTVHDSLQVFVMNEYQSNINDPTSVFDFDSMSTSSCSYTSTSSTSHLNPSFLDFDLDIVSLTSFDPEANDHDRVAFNHVQDLCIWAKHAVSSLRVDIRAIQNINRIFQNGCVNTTMYRNINLLLFVAARRLGTCDIQGFDWCVNEIRKTVSTRFYV